jgi:hypothetical protein
MAQLPPASRQDLLTIVTTEHVALQGARSATISDANGRTSFFLSTLSAGVVALAFIAQVAQVGTAFIVLALILLPSILIIGLSSFQRLLQLGIENIRIVAAINRLRRYYLEVAPELRAHFTLSDNDDAHGVLTSLGSMQGALRPWDIYVTNAGLVAIIDGIVSGVLGALIAVALGQSQLTCVVAGLISGAIVLGGLSLYLGRTWRSAISTFGVRFSSRADMDLEHALPAPAERPADLQ